MSSLSAAQLALPEHAAGDKDISVLPRIFEDAIIETTRRRGLGFQENDH